MLIIRQAQMAALRAAKMEQFAEAQSRVIRENHGEFFQYYSDEQLFTWTLNQLIYLDNHQIDTQTAMVKILDLLAIFGEAFERCKDASWALNILEDPSYSADYKAALLEHEAQIQLEKNNFIL